MELKSKILLTMLFLILGGMIFLLFSPESLVSYGKLTVGNQMFLADWFKPLLVSSRNPPLYFVYYFDKNISLPWPDTPYRASTKKILDEGGAFAALDLKGAEGAGIPMIHNGVTFESADSLVVITGSDGIIRGIFRNVAPYDITFLTQVVWGKEPLFTVVRRQVNKAEGLLRQFCDRAMGIDI